MTSKSSQKSRNSGFWNSNCIIMLFQKGVVVVDFYTVSVRKCSLITKNVWIVVLKAVRFSFRIVMLKCNMIVILFSFPIYLIWFHYFIRVNSRLIINHILNVGCPIILYVHVSVVRMFIYKRIAQHSVDTCRNTFWIIWFNQWKPNWIDVQYILIHCSESEMLRCLRMFQAIA